MNAALLAAPEGELKIPRAACLLQEVDAPIVLAQVDADGKKGNRFEMVALTGKPLRHWWYGTLAIELSGIKFKKKMPVLKDHDPDQRVGYTTSLRVDDSRGLVAEGQLLQTSEAAKAILADSQEGFPWQASTYLEPKTIVRLGDGEEGECNGRKVRGPGVIFRQCTLREVTFTALGVDDDTSATSLAADVAGDVVAVLSLNTQPMTKTTEGTAPVAAAATGASAVSTPQDQAKLAADTLAAERKRVATIHGAAAEAQAKLAQQLIADGVSTEDALLKLNEDLRARLSAQKPAAATEALGAGNSAGGTPAGGRSAGPAKLNESDPSTWEKAWTEDAALRAEFRGNKDVFLSAMRNYGKGKLFGSKKDFVETSKEGD